MFLSLDLATEETHTYFFERNRCFSRWFRCFHLGFIQIEIPFMQRRLAFLFDLKATMRSKEVQGRIAYPFMPTDS